MSELLCHFSIVYRQMTFINLTFFDWCLGWGDRMNPAQPQKYYPQGSCQIIYSCLSK